MFKSIRRIFCMLFAPQSPRCHRLLNAELFAVSRELTAWADRGLLPPRSVVDHAMQINRRVVRDGLISIDSIRYGA